MNPLVVMSIGLTGNGFAGAVTVVIADTRDHAGAGFRSALWMWLFILFAAMCEGGVIPLAMWAGGQP